MATGPGVRQEHVPYSLLHHAALGQQHLRLRGCSPRRISFQTPQSFPLAEIAGSEHKHRRLSPPPHVSHQLGMVSSPSIHHTGFLSLLLQDFSASPSPSAWPRGCAALPGGRRGGRREGYHAMTPKLRTLPSQVLRSAAPVRPGPHHEAGPPQIQRKQMRGWREQRPPPPS